jgi:hypothetical protein
MVASDMGPQDPKDVVMNVVHVLSSLTREFAASKGMPTNGSTDLKYATIKHNLENAHAMVEAAPIKVKRWMHSLTRASSASRSFPCTAHGIEFQLTVFSRSNLSSSLRA